MKGLLIKDIHLMKNQGKVLIIMCVLMAIMFGTMNGNIYGAAAYVTFILTLFTVSTISYDEYDNGYLFLFTLPITRKQYINEKYLFVLVLNIVVITVEAIVAAILMLFTDGQETFGEMLMIFGLYSMAMLILNSIMIPLRVKFDAEKGKIVLPIVIGAIAVVTIVLVKASSKLPEHFKMSIVEMFGGLNATELVLIAVGVTALCYAVSWIASQKILEKKEF